ncbi:hypothetical protein DFJ74DRAFT_644925 [Hyaloraphidium curvatum]|nr:hypothetical protein DFJ74DRAFT_644925 [Hyaloraphidium curvatum]
MAWTELGSTGVYLLEYNAEGFGPTNALAVPLGGGGFAVLSPPPAPADAQLAFFESGGRTLKAIAAPHSGHTLGLAMWAARFPDAPVYAPGPAVAEVERKVGKDLGGRRVLPFSDLQKEIGGGKAVFRDVHGSKNGSCVVLVPGSREKPSVLYADEFVGNQEEKALPLMVWVIRQLFYWTGSAPGLAVNRVFRWILVTDYRKITAALREALEECDKAAGDAGTIVVVSHGPPLLKKEEVDAFRKLINEWA